MTADTVFLAAIALATLVMAAVQVGVIVYAGRLARRVERLADRVERDMNPIIGRLHALSDDAARVASLAVAQVERADRVFSDFAQRLDHTLSLVQQAIVIPAREGLALVSALKAGLSVLRRGGSSAARSRRAEDEEALFIG